MMHREAVVRLCCIDRIVKVVQERTVKAHSGTGYGKESKASTEITDAAFANPILDQRDVKGDTAYILEL
jgi:hypothetical protein